MTTLAEIHGEMPTLRPLTIDVHGFTSPEALASLEMAEFGAQEATDEVPGPCVTTETPEATRWTIDSVDKANWYLKKLRGIDDETATIKAQAAEMLRSLEADRNRLNARHEADFLAFAKEELARKGNGKKTLPLMQGTVAFRTVPASLRITAAPAIEHAKAQGWDVVKTVESLDSEGYKREAAAVLSQTGEVLPGVEIVPERESVSIKFGKGKGGESEE